MTLFSPAWGVSKQSLTDVASFLLQSFFGLAAKLWGGPGHGNNQDLVIYGISYSRILARTFKEFYDNTIWTNLFHKVQRILQNSDNFETWVENPAQRLQNLQMKY